MTFTRPASRLLETEAGFMRSNIGKYEKLDVRQEGRLALRLKPILQAAAHALFSVEIGMDVLQQPRHNKLCLRSNCL